MISVIMVVILNLLSFNHGYQDHGVLPVVSVYIPYTSMAACNADKANVEVDAVKAFSGPVKVIAQICKEVPANPAQGK
jgi:hypothetical protein